MPVLAGTSSAASSAAEVGLALLPLAALQLLRDIGPCSLDRPVAIEVGAGIAVRSVVLATLNAAQSGGCQVLGFEASGDRVARAAEAVSGNPGMAGRITL